MPYKLHQDVDFPRDYNRSVGDYLWNFYHDPSTGETTDVVAFDVEDEHELERMKRQLIQPILTFIGDYRMLDPFFLDHLLKSGVKRTRPDGRRYSKELIHAVSFVLDCARELLIEMIVKGFQGQIHYKSLIDFVFIAWFLAMKQVGLVDWFRARSPYFPPQSMLEILLVFDPKVDKAWVIRMSDLVLANTEWRGCYQTQTLNTLTANDVDRLNELMDKAEHFQQTKHVRDTPASRRSSQRSRRSSQRSQRSRRSSQRSRRSSQRSHQSRQSLHFSPRSRRSKQ